MSNSLNDNGVAHVQYMLILQTILQHWVSNSQPPDYQTSATLSLKLQLIKFVPLYIYKTE